MEKKTKVAILIPNYNGKDLLDDCLSSVSSTGYDSIDQFVYVVDNASSDGSLEYLKESWPSVRIVSLDENHGYAGGNNRGWEVIQRDIPDLDYLYLLNSDTIVAEKFLEPLVSYMNVNNVCAAAQSKLLLHPDTSKINSLGNNIHFLGFGYATCFNLNADSIPDRINRINYASGAAVMLRSSVIKEVGLFEDFMFMYLEDLDLGWRIGLSGRTNMLVPESTVFHKFEFSRGMKQYYFFERNRLWILFANYKIPTLLLLLPAFLFMEIGQILFALLNGRFKDKMRSYAYFLTGQHRESLKIARKRISKIRTVTDRQMIKSFSGNIKYQPLNNIAVRFVANPVLSVYHGLLSLIIVW